MPIVNQAPAGLPLSPAQVLVIRRFNLALVVLNCIFFGIFLALAVTVLQRLWRRVRRLPRMTYLLIASHILAVTCLYSIWIATTSIQARHQLQYKVGDVRPVPKHTTPHNVLAYMSILFVGILNDSMLTYRCWIICERTRLIIVPILLLTTKAALYFSNGVLFFLDPTYHSSNKLLIPGLCVSLSNHLILSAAGCARLLSYRKNARPLGTSGEHYVHVAYLLAIGCALYACANIASLVANSTPVQPVTNATIFAVGAICPLFIPLNVASSGDGSGVDSELEDGLEFAEPSRLRDLKDSIHGTPSAPASCDSHDEATTATTASSATYTNSSATIETPKLSTSDVNTLAQSPPLRT